MTSVCRETTDDDVTHTGSCATNADKTDAGLGVDGLNRRKQKRRGGKTRTTRRISTPTLLTSATDYDDAGVMSDAEHQLTSAHHETPQIAEIQLDKLSSATTKLEETTSTRHRRARKNCRETETTAGDLTQVQTTRLSQTDATHSERQTETIHETGAVADRKWKNRRRKRIRSATASHTPAVSGPRDGNSNQQRRTQSSGRPRISTGYQLSTDNQDIKNWLKTKNKLIRKRRAEERKIQRQKRKEEEGKRKEMEHRKIESEKVVGEWMRKKKLEEQKPLKEKTNSVQKLTEQSTCPFVVESDQSQQSQAPVIDVIKPPAAPTNRTKSAPPRPSTSCRSPERSASGLKQAMRLVEPSVIVMPEADHQDQTSGNRAGMSGCWLSRSRTAGSGKARVSFDEWLSMKKTEDQLRRDEDARRRLEVESRYDPISDAIVRGVARRRIDAILTEKQRIDTGIKRLDKMANSYPSTPALRINPYRIISDRPSAATDDGRAESQRSVPNTSRLQRVPNDENASAQRRDAATAAGAAAATTTTASESDGAVHKSEQDLVHLSDKRLSQIADQGNATKVAVIQLMFHSENQATRRTTQTPRRIKNAPGTFPTVSQRSMTGIREEPAQHRQHSNQRHLVTSERSVNVVPGNMTSSLTCGGQSDLDQRSLDLGDERPRTTLGASRRPLSALTNRPMTAVGPRPPSCGRPGSAVSTHLRPSTTGRKVVVDVRPSSDTELRSVETETDGALQGSTYSKQETARPRLKPALAPAHAYTAVGYQQRSWDGFADFVWNSVIEAEEDGTGDEGMSKVRPDPVGSESDEVRVECAVNDDSLSTQPSLKLSETLPSSPARESRHRVLPLNDDDAAIQ